MFIHILTLYTISVVSIGVLLLTAEKPEQLELHDQDQDRTQRVQGTEVSDINGTIIKKTKTGILIPYYGDQPSRGWDKIIEAKIVHPDLPMIVVVNPDNGPGNYKDKKYVLPIQRLQSAGIIVLGYTYTAYAHRSADSIRADIDAYKNWYGVDGIAFDEMSNKPGYESYYKGLSDFAKCKGLKFTIGNPGTHTLESYIGTVDNIIIYENKSSPGIQNLGSKWYSKYDKENFSILLIGEKDLNAKYIKNASKYVSYIYVTDDDVPDPWNTLPHYFDELVISIDNSDKS